MGYLLSIKVRLWTACLISIMLVIPAFIIGWAAGIHDGFDTGSKVKALEIRSALMEGMRDRAVFFISDIRDVGFHPGGQGKLGVCASSADKERERKVSIQTYRGLGD